MAKQKQIPNSRTNNRFTGTLKRVIVDVSGEHVNVELTRG